MTSPFDHDDADDLAALIGESPFGWIVPHADPAVAMLMPLLCDRNADGGIAAITSHLPRRCPATTALAEDGRVTFLFLGPNAYIDPTMAGRDTWAPTWNFVAASLTGTLAFDEALTDDVLARLVRHMEGDDGWNRSSLGARYDELASRVIGFRAPISHTKGRFKLGQDEAPAEQTAIRKALGHTPLGRWIDRVLLGRR